MAMTKAEVRRAALERRDALSEEARAAFAQRLAGIGPRLALDFAPAGHGLAVSLFSSIGREPDMGPLAAGLHGADVMLALPVTGPRGTALSFRRWAPGDAMAFGRMGIAEPLPSAAVVEPDLLFVPLAAFDRRGHRIGYGAGHYDRTLEALRARKVIRAIGVAFATQEVLFIPDDVHDQPLDLVVTERDTLVCGD